MSSPDPRDGPSIAAQLIVQGDHTILLETSDPGFETARAQLCQFAELTKSPEHVHFYRTTPLSLWNAAAVGISIDDIVGWLQGNARYPIAPAVLSDLATWHARYGLLRFLPGAAPDELVLACDDARVLQELLASAAVQAVLDRDRQAARSPVAQGGDVHASAPAHSNVLINVPGTLINRSRDLLTNVPGTFINTSTRVSFAAAQRGALKQALVGLGYPVQDLAGYEPGAALSLRLRACSRSGKPFVLREYQRRAAEMFHLGGSTQGGCGVIVLPCGAGKTVVALAAMELLQTRTLVLTTNTVAVRQWRAELLDKTELQAHEVGEYTGDQKQIRPVTIATYQILTWRKHRRAEFAHFGLFADHPWGLVIYDEVHLLPAPVFRATAAIQARRRLGLTATLVREDGKQHEVFALIGPKRYEQQWKQLERQGFLAAARCHELRVAMSEPCAQSYRGSRAREQFKIASENPAKQAVVSLLLERHAGDRVLVIGQFLAQLRALAQRIRMPLITGKTRNDERERLYAAFKSGAITRLCISKVGNFAIDLPDANVAIQVSGTFGSRQEEAQRLGRVLRPKPDGGGAWFYSLVSEGSREQEFARKRQLFLTEQGYRYEICSAAEALAPAPLDPEPPSALLRPPPVQCS